MRLLPAVLLIAVLLGTGCSRFTYAPASQSQPAYSDTTYADTTADSLDVGALERRLHERINEKRASHDLNRLRWSDTLATVARGHSQEMADQDFFAHENPAGEDATARGAQAGFTCRKTYEQHITTGLGENIFYTYPYTSYEVRRSGNQTRRRYNWKTPRSLVQEIAQGWMQSPAHRRNLLNPRYDQEGIGLARADDRRLYVTQVLC